MTERIIRVRLDRVGDHALVIVADNGPGFPDNVLRAAGRDMQSTKVQGGGIGLVIVRELVEAHGGHITFENGARGGARVVTALPICHSPSLKKDSHEPSATS